METVRLHRDEVDALVWEDLILRFPKAVNEKGNIITLKVKY